MFLLLAKPVARFQEKLRLPYGWELFLKTVIQIQWLRVKEQNGVKTGSWSENLWSLT